MVLILVIIWFGVKHQKKLVTWRRVKGKNVKREWVGEVKTRETSNGGCC